MIENTITLTVDQPRERVFDFLTDLPNEPLWNPDCSSVEMLSPEPSGRDRPIAVTSAEWGR